MNTYEQNCAIILHLEENAAILKRANLLEKDISVLVASVARICPVDKIKQDNDLCNSKEGFCFSGNCVHMHKMCQLAYSSRFILYKYNSIRILFI
ncbi:hypothetical protein HZS_4785 [Henneguya salminicola]|nr:hypothetical protein HZS_4785 [Henneguya salminicola]